MTNTANHPSPPAPADAAGDPTPEAVDTQPPPPPPPTAPETILEMRQVAGLTAGSVMGLHAGSFQFRESDKDIGFSLSVAGPEAVTVLAGSAGAMIDEVEVVDASPITLEVLHVGSACFTVRPIRPEPTSAERLQTLKEARTPHRAIEVPSFVDDEPTTPQTRSSRFGSLFSSSSESEGGLGPQAWQLLEAVRETRSNVAERHRRIHPDPEELRSRLERLDPGLWDRTAQHQLFARIPIAYASIPWEPRFDEPELIPTVLHEPIQQMSCLPWVPITAGLLNGPLGIVGSRAAVLACARNAILSLACVTAPTDIEFSIVTGQDLVTDWDWTSALPNSLFPSYGSDVYPVAVADGMAHFEGAGLDPEAVKNNEMGLIVLAATADELPDYCGTVLEVTHDGGCRVTNHLGEQITGTPIGVTAGFATAMAALVREAIGDEFQTPTTTATAGAADDSGEPDPELAADAEGADADINTSADTDTDTDTDIDADIDLRTTPADIEISGAKLMTAAESTTDTPAFDDQDGFDTAGFTITGSYEPADLIDPSQPVEPDDSPAAEVAEAATGDDAEDSPADDDAPSDESADEDEESTA